MDNTDSKSAETRDWTNERPVSRYCDPLHANVNDQNLSDEDWFKYAYQSVVGLKHVMDYVMFDLSWLAGAIVQRGRRFGANVDDERQAFMAEFGYDFGKFMMHVSAYLKSKDPNTASADTGESK